MKETQDYLASKGIRASVQRIAIMKYLHTHHNHPTVDQVYEALHPDMPTLSKTTIYNTLKLFEAKGAIQIINIDEHNARMDANFTPHAHFLCIQCGMIYDIPLSKSNTDIAAVLVENPSLSDYQINDTQIYHKGLCPKCRKK